MRQSVLGSAVLFVSLFVCVSGLFGFTITVDCNGGGDYMTIQDGIDASVDGDTVLVSPCTYTGLGNRDIDFDGKAIVVMSSDGPEATIIDCQDLGRGFIFDSVELNSSILDGFTIKNGTGASGGGIDVYYAAPTITNCSIVNNFAFGGGGISVNGGSPDINNCTIEGNISTGYGGGMYLSTYSGFGSGPRISNCTFKDNSAEQKGGGLYYADVRSQFSYSFIWGCRFENNTTTSYSTYGGGIYLKDSKVSVYNCLFDSNAAPSEGGGIYCFDSDVLIHNCTFVYNYAGGYGSGISISISNTTIFNCILWWNGASPIYGSPTTVTYSNIEGGWSGAGNIDTDPLFAEEIDYHLEPGSPCVDAGDPAILDGSLPPGLGGERSDMGTYGGTENGELLEGPYDLFLYPTGPTTVTVGDTIFFDALIWNSTNNPAQGNYWLTIIMPDEREILIPSGFLSHSNPLYGSTPAHGTNTISNELRTLLTGTYTVIGRIGIYPNAIADEESFEIEVVP